MITPTRLSALLFIVAGLAFVAAYFMSGRVLNLAAAAMLFAAGTLLSIASRTRVPPS